jgi:LysM repeat protein
MEGSPACPFIAYEDERDERSAEPDHAHRCYAEVRPAPRALAHQEAYCLSSAFPVCPTFQAWARREAAQARTAAAASAADAASAAAASSPTNGSTEPEDTRTQAVDEFEGEDEAEAEAEAAAVPGPAADETPGVDPDGDSDDLPARRNPPRDWAAPPPWATGASGAAAARSATSGEPPDFLVSRGAEGQGLAGSAADRLAGGPVPSGPRPPTPAIPSSEPSAPADPELAGLVGGAQTRSYGGADESASPPPPTRPVKRPPVSSTRDRNVDRTPVQTGPSWEKARRYEAYPTIKTRAGMPDVPRVLLLAGVLGVATLAVFFLPAMLGIGSPGSGPSAAPSESVAIQTSSPSATTPAAATPQVYVVKSGDTFTKIAKKYNLTNAQLKAANPAIKDINKIKVGDEIKIPAPPVEVIEPSAKASASP